MNTVNKLLSDAGLSPREAKGHGLQFRVLTIGPEEARALLAANTDNRPMRPGRVKFYARVMKEGGWMLTHQGIAFSRDGLGIDLQHRMSAVVLSGVSIQVLVVEGLDPAAFKAVDQHERRSMSDALKLDRRLTEEAKMFLLIAGGDTAAQPTLDEVFDACGDIEQEHESLLSSCNTVKAIFSSAPIRAAAITLMAERPANITVVGWKYRDLVLERTEVWTRTMHAFGRQARDGKTVNTASTPGRLDLYARALAALDPDRSGLSKIQIDDVALRLARERGAAVIGRKFIPRKTDSEKASQPNAPTSQEERSSRT